MRIQLFYIALLCFFFSYIEEIKGENKHERLIESLVNDGHKSIFPNHYSIIIFYKCTNNKISSSDISNLVEKYKFEFNNMDYQEYLLGVMNGEIIINCNFESSDFNLNDTIMNTYNNVEFSFFLTKYNKYLGNNDKGEKEYSVCHDLSYEAQLTVLYCLFLNEYYSEFNDYDGFFYSVKIEDFSEPEAEFVLGDHGEIIWNSNRKSEKEKSQELDNNTN